MTSIRWSHSASADLTEIVDWIIENHSAAQAASFVDQVDERLTQVAQFPDSGRVVPELQAQNIISYRELVISPWRLIYRYGGDEVLVLAVFDGRRNIDDVLLWRNLR